MNAQFNKGVLELCVLARIAESDVYGYELVRDISRTIQISEGTIYPILRRLTDDRLCETYLRESNEGPPRKYYRMTAKGRESLQRLLSDWKTFSRSVNKFLNSGASL